MDFHEKFIALSELNEGDKVKIIDGRTVTFVRLKRKKFIGILEGTRYDIPVEHFKEVAERVNMDAIQKEKNKEIESLKEDELFYINYNGDAILYRFKGIQNGRILGESVLPNGGKGKIDIALYQGKVSDL